MKAAIVNRFVACTVFVLAGLVGGGSLLAFAAFLFAGSFTITRFGVSDAQGLLLDGFLSVLFFIQHSGMVRQSFRQWLSTVIPECYYSAAYAIASGAVLATVVLLWQTSSTVLFEIPQPFQWLLRTFSLLAIAGTLWGILALRAFDAFGLNAITSQLRGQQPRSAHFVVRGPYVWVRHPLYFFVLVLVWSAPQVTSDRLLFDVLWTTWIVLGAYLEERDLVAEFGERYRRYQKTVPMLIPWRGAAGRNL